MNDTIKVVAVGTSYVFSVTHQYLSDLGGNTVGSAVALATKAVGSGIYSAANATLAAMPNGTTVLALVIYKDTGTSTTSPLIAYLDTANGLPFTGTGADVTVVWDPSTNRIFQF